MSSEIPDWYVLKDPGRINVNVNEWHKYALDRLERFLHEELWIINRPTWISDEEWFEIKVQEVGGHFLLRLAVARNPRLTSWLVEVEGDLFEFRFITSPSFEDKILVLKDLYGEENVKTIPELNELYKTDFHRKYNLADVLDKRSMRVKSRFGSNVRDLEKRVGIRFFKIPQIISTKKALLHDGWAIVKLIDIRLTVKREFEKQLKTIIEKSKILLDKDPALVQTIKPIIDKIDEIAKSSRYGRDFKKLGIEEGEEIYTKPDIFPPCIQELLNVLQSKGHLSHAENWQLGTFLKRAGMPIEDQYKFWYHNSVDNIGTSYDEFVRKVGYQIEHIYGKTGGGTDYDPPSCKTCINGYFCFWAHKKLEDIDIFIRKNFEDKDKQLVERAIEDISKLIINQNFQYACAMYFTLQTGWKFRGKVNHMLSYAKLAYNRFYGKKTQEKKEKKQLRRIKTDKGVNN
ncbi:MAG: hypothetical protein ACTSSF_05940 [Candidatus Heimdallarchaeaceae archaeon]